DQGRERHDRYAANVFQHAALDGVVGAINHDLEPVFDQRAGGVQRFRHVGEEVVGTAQDLELDEVVAVEQLACQAQRAHRVVGSETSGSVRQYGVFAWRDDVQKVGLAWVLTDVAAPDGNGNDFGATGFNGPAG